MGLESEIHPFITVSRGMSIYPLTYLTLTAIGIFTYLIGYPVITLILFALSASMHFRIPNYVKIYKYIFPASAHNVFAKIIIDKSKPNIILTGHLDTARRTMFVKHYGKVFWGVLRNMLKKNSKKLDTGLKPLPILQSPYGFFNFGMLVF